MCLPLNSCSPDHLVFIYCVVLFSIYLILLNIISLLLFKLLEVISSLKNYLMQCLAELFIDPSTWYNVPYAPIFFSFLSPQINSVFLTFCFHPLPTHFYISKIVFILQSPIKSKNEMSLMFPQTTIRFRYSLDRFTELREAVIVVVIVYFNKRIQIKISKGKSTLYSVQEIPGFVFICSLPVESYGQH